jgi:Tol biopolymer transport system component
MDRVAVGSAIALGLAIIIFVVRGDQVGVQITRSTPISGATNVPTRGLLAFTFSEQMNVRSLEGNVRITPEISGTLRWNGPTAFFVAAEPLQADTDYTLTIRAGATSTRGRQLLRDEVITFRTGHPRVVYLAPSSGASNLYVFDPTTNEVQKLSNEQFRIYDYAVSPDGSRIVYSLDREEKNPERDIWVMNSDGTGRERLVQCDGQACQAMSWNGSGTRIAYERRALVQGAIGRSPGPARIWLADVNTKETAPLFRDEQQIGSLPRYSTVGDKLAYYDQLKSTVVVVDTLTSDQVDLPSLLGDPGAWSPDGNALVYPELQALDAGRYSQLLKANLVTNIITAVTPLSASNDASAAWSPTGQLLAFGRQQTGVGGGVGILGPQLWLVAPDGTNPRQITSDGEFSHGAFAWSPDGQWIVLQRFNLLQQNAVPEIWIIRPDGSDRRKIADDATLPEWLP